MNGRENAETLDFWYNARWRYHSEKNVELPVLSSTSPYGGIFRRAPVFKLVEKHMRG